MQAEVAKFPFFFLKFIANCLRPEAAQSPVFFLKFKEIACILRKQNFKSFLQNSNKLHLIQKIILVLDLTGNLNVMKNYLSIFSAEF